MIPFGGISNNILNENKSVFNIKINKKDNKDNKENLDFRENEIHSKIKSKNKINKKEQKNVEINILDKKSNKENNKSKIINLKQSLEIQDQTNDNKNKNWFSKQNNNLLIKKEKEKLNKIYISKTSKKFENEENNFDEDRKNSELLYLKLEKNKKVYKPKKVYFIKFLSFIDEKNNIKEFKLYKDFELGFGKNYKVKHLFQDNDIDSDDSSIKHGYNISFMNISRAIKLMKNRDEEYVGKYLKYFKN